MTQPGYVYETNANSCMNDGAQFLLSFEISSNGEKLSIEAFRLVRRADVSYEALSNSKFFESSCKSLAAALVTEDHVLVARQQEQDSRSKRPILIERLDTSLYCIYHCPQNVAQELQATSATICAELGMFAQHVVPDFALDNWWGPYVQEVEQHLRPGSKEIQLDLGLQPVIVNDPIDSLQTVEGFIDELTQAYLEMLYINRASLVFFAKHTLPKLRLRVVEATSLHVSFQHDYAIQILQGIVPNFQDLDLKYKKVLPEIAEAELAGHPLDSDSLSKLELGVIKDWLGRCRDEMTPCTSELICLRILPALKARQYQLLILLLLEVLLIRQDAPVSSEYPDNHTNVADGDPALLIDVLLDRLAISQTLDILQADDQLQLFCMEVLQPFYSTRLPELMDSIRDKYLLQDDFIPQMPTTPADVQKKRSNKYSQKSGNTASLKRTYSAPANLLSDRRTMPKKRNLGREVSMTKRAPSFEIATTKPAYTKSTRDFEERRKLKNDAQTQDRIQVGQTPAKRRIQDFAQHKSEIHSEYIAHLEISKQSKASFMTIGETPVKKSSAATISETPTEGHSTPTRIPSRVFNAPFDGIQDTPTGRSILFKLDSPIASRKRPVEDTSSSDVGKPGGIRKCVTFSGGLHSDQEEPSGSSMRNIFEPENEGINSFFGPEITSAQHKASSPGLSDKSIQSITLEDKKQSTKGLQEALQEELDWL